MIYSSGRRFAYDVASKTMYEMGEDRFQAMPPVPRNWAPEKKKQKARAFKTFSEDIGYRSMEL